MKKCSWRDSNSRLLTGISISYPLDQQYNNAGKCNFLVTIFKGRRNSIYIIVYKLPTVLNRIWSAHPRNDFIAVTCRFSLKDFPKVATMEESASYMKVEYDDISLMALHLKSSSKDDIIMGQIMASI